MGFVPVATEEADGMTEDQAKQKWCPYQEMRAQASAHTIMLACTRWPDDSEKFAKGANENKKCIGSDCMMWQTTSQEYDKIGADGFPTRDAHMTISGYCGLAGKP